jgi:hypothetical protein
MIVIPDPSGDKNDFDHLTYVKGQIISDFIWIEHKLNDVIIKKIQPSDTKFFKDIVLNSSILGIGQKIKIINNVDGIKDSSLVSLIRDMNNIRNGLAHANFNYTLAVQKNQVAKTEIITMNSEGIIKRKNVDELIASYVELSNKAHSLLDDYLNGVE